MGASGGYPERRGSKKREDGASAWDGGKKGSLRREAWNCPRGGNGSERMSQGKLRDRTVRAA